MADGEGGCVKDCLLEASEDEILGSVGWKRATYADMLMDGMPRGKYRQTSLFRFRG